MKLIGKKIYKMMMVALVLSMFSINIINANSSYPMDQVILVVGTGGYNAQIKMYEKNIDDTWSEKLSANGYVGKNGITENKREGDGKTPTGIYTLGTAFGIQSNPGTNLNYRKVTKNDYWVDDSNSKYYNQWVDITKVKKDWKSAEYLYSHKTAYKYGVVVNYNMNPIIPGKGSAIFLHNSTNGPTAGCISMPEKSLVSLMKMIKPNARILIAKDKYSIPSDTYGHWAESAINDFKDKGFVDGYPDGSFKPNGYMTRAEFVKTINKVFGFTQIGENRFEDVNTESWYYNDICIATNIGYINGRSDTVFDPNSYITRQEAAKIISTVIGSIDYNIDKIYNFKDAQNIADWAIPYVEGALEYGYMNGLPDNSFSPNRNITRAEVVVSLSRVIK